METLWRILGLRSWQSEVRELHWKQCEIEYQLEDYMSQTDTQIERLTAVIGKALDILKDVRDDAQAVIDNDAADDTAQAAAIDQAGADKLSTVVDAFEAALAPAPESDPVDPTVPDESGSGDAGDDVPADGEPVVGPVEGETVI